MVAQRARVKDESIVNAIKCSALSSKVIAAKKEFAQACQNGDTAAVRKFSKNSGFPIDTPLDLGFSGLQLACRAGQTQVAAILLMKKASLKFKRYGRTNVLQAVASTKVKEIQGPLECLTMLLRPLRSMDKNSPAYLDVNDVCNNDSSALMLAARRGHVGMVEALLKAGANKEYKNAKGRTAYDVAVGAGNLNIAKILDPEAEISIDVPSSPTGNTNKQNRAKENPFVAAKLQLDVNDHVEETWEDVGKLAISEVEDSAGVDGAVFDAADDDSAVYSSNHEETEEVVEVVEEVISPVSEETVCNTDLLSYGPSNNPIVFKKDRETGRNRLYLALKLEDLDEYCDKLDRMYINYDRFITFNEQDLRRIGVMNDNHRARMMELISRFRVQNEASAASDRRTSYAKSVRIVSGNAGSETKCTMDGPQHALSEQRKGRRFPGFVSPFSEPISENINLSAVSGGGFETDIVSTDCGTHQRFAMHLRKLCKLVALFAFLACYFVLEQSDFRFLF